MIVKAWNNGSHQLDGNGYGIKIPARDRDQYFDTNWKSISLELDGRVKPIEVNIDKESFWNDTCRELISKEIGKWLIENHFGQWQARHPPELELQKVGDRKFHLGIPNQN